VASAQIQAIFIDAMPRARVWTANTFLTWLSAVVILTL